MLQNPKKMAKVFTEELKNLLGSNLLSVFMYGSIATGDFLPAQSNLNFLVVLDQLDPLTFAKLSERGKRWTKQFKTTPLFLTKKEILSSADVFPLEFSEIKDKHIWIYGENILRKLNIPKKALRLQCEHELRRKLILLREGYLHKPSHVKDLLGLSAGSIAVLMRGIIHLKKEKAPLKHEEVIAEAAELFGINPQPFLKALELRRVFFLLNQKELHFVFQNYVAELKKLTEKIDTLRLG
jgi:predicted nucleotidyltransferase